jgi:hypothetical protein
MSSNRAHLIQSSNIVVSLSSSFSIEYIQPLVIKNDEIVSVKVKSLTPDGGDWVGAYATFSLSSLDTRLRSPLKFGYCDQHRSRLHTFKTMYDNSYLQSGQSELEFSLTNVRSGVAFVYFKNGTDYPIEVARSLEMVSFVNINEPLRNRVVPTGDPDVLKVLWSSATSTEPVLLWGLKPIAAPAFAPAAASYQHSHSHSQSRSQSQSLTVVRAASSRVDRTSSVCGGAAAGAGWHDLGLLHAANISGILSLSWNSENEEGEGEGELSGSVSVGDNLRRIYYRVGDAASGDFSEQFTLFVPPAAGDWGERDPDEEGEREGEGEGGQSSDNRGATSAMGKASRVHTRQQDDDQHRPQRVRHVEQGRPGRVIEQERGRRRGRGRGRGRERATQVVLMADLGVGTRDSSADAEVYAEPCYPALNTSRSVRRLAQSGDLDAVFLSGDIAYANGYLSNWDFFLDMISPIAGMYYVFFYSPSSSGVVCSLFLVTVV